MKRQKIKIICQECGDEFEAYDLGPLTRQLCETCSKARAVQEEQDRYAQQLALAEVRYRQLVAGAKIPKVWRDVTFENSDPAIRRGPFKIARKYAESFNAESGTLVFYSAGYGCGKTHLAVCIGNYVLHRLRRPVLFRKARDLLLEIRRTFSEKGTETEADILDHVLSVELLILDDVGVDNSSHWIESTYWTIFDRRLEWQLPTIVTTNYPLEADSRKVTLSERIGYGAVSRLSRMCRDEFIDMTGPDLR
jgi:DNA replication protein DnaC